MPATSAIAVVPAGLLIAARLGDQRTSAMAADIVEGAYPSVSAPHDQQCRPPPNLCFAKIQMIGKDRSS
jgi:hypothetical protein